MCGAGSCCCLVVPGSPSTRGWGAPAWWVQTRRCHPHGHCVPPRTNPDPQGLAGASGGHGASGQTGWLSQLLACGFGAYAACETPVLGVVYPPGAREPWAMPAAGAVCGVAGTVGMAQPARRAPKPCQLLLHCCFLTGRGAAFALRGPESVPTSPQPKIPKGLEMPGRATPCPCAAAGQDCPQALPGYLTGETEAQHSCGTSPSGNSPSLQAGGTGGPGVLPSPCPSWGPGRAPQHWPCLPGPHTRPRSPGPLPQGLPGGAQLWPGGAAPHQLQAQHQPQRRGYPQAPHQPQPPCQRRRLPPHRSGPQGRAQGPQDPHVLQPHGRRGGPLHRHRGHLPAADGRGPLRRCSGEPAGCGAAGR